MYTPGRASGVARQCQRAPDGLAVVDRPRAPRVGHHRDQLQTAPVDVARRRPELARDGSRGVVDLDQQVLAGEPQPQLDRRAAVDDGSGPLASAMAIGPDAIYWINRGNGGEIMKLRK